MVLELQQANPEDVQLHISSKELRIMRYLITRGLCMPRTSLSLVVDIKKCLADLRGQTPPSKATYLHLIQNQESAIFFKYIYIYKEDPIIMVEIITVEYASQELHSFCALTLKSVFS